MENLEGQFNAGRAGSHCTFLWGRLCPEPNQVNLDRLDLNSFFPLTVPRSFIYCRHDKALPPGFHPRMSPRLEESKLLEMDGGHEVMFTRPVELADKIIEASSDADRLSVSWHCRASWAVN